MFAILDCVSVTIWCCSLEGSTGLAKRDGSVFCWQREKDVVSTVEKIILSKQRPLEEEIFLCLFGKSVSCCFLRWSKILK